MPGDYDAVWTNHRLFFYGRSFSIHSRAPSVGTEGQIIPHNKRNNASGGSRPSDKGWGWEGTVSNKKKEFFRFGLKMGGGGPPLDPLLNTTKE